MRKSLSIMRPGPRGWKKKTIARWVVSETQIVASKNGREREREKKKGLTIRYSIVVFLIYYEIGEI